MARKKLPFVRTTRGYDPDSVQEVLFALEQFYRTEELAAQSHLWDVVRSLEFLGPLAQTTEAICAIVAPASVQEPAPLETLEPKPIVLPEPPPLQLLEAWFGYRPEDVDAVIVAYRKRCEGELADLLRETAQAEAERATLNRRLSLALARLRQVNAEVPALQERGSGMVRAIALR